MNLIRLMLRNELRLNFKRIISGLLFTIIGTVLMYLFLVPGLGKILPRLDLIELNMFMFSSVIAFVTSLTAVGIASSWTNRYFSDTHGDYQRIAGSVISQIYGGALTCLGLITFFYLIISTLILATLIGYIPGFGTLLLFWIYGLPAMLVFLQIGILIGLDNNQRNHFFWMVLVIVPLFLMSGMLIPSHYFNEFGRIVLSALPSTAYVEGGRSILLHQSLAILNVFYLVILNVFLFIGVLYFFKRKLNK